MSVQKITGLTQQKKSLKPNNAAKNGFLNGISFKGYTKEVTMRNGSRPYSYRDSYGTSGTLREYSGHYASVESYNVEHPENTTVKRGNDGYIHQDYDSASVHVYYADPGEQITDKIKNNHAYIVEYDQIPDIVSTDKISKATKSSEVKEFIETLKIRETYIKNGIQTAYTEVQNAKAHLEVTRKAFEAAKVDYSKKVQDKQSLENQLYENSERLTLAKNVLAKLTKKEEDDFKAAQTREALTKMQEQLGEMNSSNDSGLSAIAEAIAKYLGK